MQIISAIVLSELKLSRYKITESKIERKNSNIKPFK